MMTDIMSTLLNQLVHLSWRPFYLNTCHSIFFFLNTQIHTKLRNTFKPSEIMCLRGLRNLPSQLHIIIKQDIIIIYYTIYWIQIYCCVIIYDINNKINIFLVALFAMTILYFTHSILKRVNHSFIIGPNIISCLS